MRNGKWSVVGAGPRRSRRRWPGTEDSTLGAKKAAYSALRGRRRVRRSGRRKANRSSEQWPVVSALIRLDDVKGIFGATTATTTMRRAISMEAGRSGFCAASSSWSRKPLSACHSAKLRNESALDLT